MGNTNPSFLKPAQKNTLKKISSKKAFGLNIELEHLKKTKTNPCNLQKYQQGYGAVNTDIIVNYTAHVATTE